MSIAHSNEHPTIGELALLERDGNGARPWISAMTDEQLGALDRQLRVAMSALRADNIRDARVDDITALAVVVRWTLRLRRGRATLDALLNSSVPR